MIGPQSKITIEQMAWVFEQLDQDVPLKSLAFDLGVHVSTLGRRIYAAEREGFDAFRHPAHKTCVTGHTRLLCPYSERNEGAAMTTLKTNNESWGFYGTMGGHAEQAWPIAFEVIGEATSAKEFTPEAIRDFLDSRDGRHFADDVNDFLHSNNGDLPLAVAQAADKWMGWTIGARASREHGIPRGLPYLTGWVLYHSVRGEY